MFSTDFIFRQQENLVDNQKSQAGYRPLRNKILLQTGNFKNKTLTKICAFQLFPRKRDNPINTLYPFRLSCAIKVILTKSCSL